LIVRIHWYGRNKTRILVTHGVSFLPQMDQILVMKAGTITEVGSYRQLLQQRGEFADFLVHYLAENEQEEEGEMEPTVDLKGLKHDLEESFGRRRLESQLSKARSERSSVASSLSNSDRKAAGVIKRETDEVPSAAAKLGETLIETERVEIGGVKWSVYLYYIKSVGYAASVTAFGFYVVFQVLAVGSNIWLSAWTDDPAAATDPRLRNMYLAVYGTIGLFKSLTIMAATMIVSIFSLNAAIKLHRTMLLRIMRSPMSFFDTTPLGRILNRCGKDIDTVDNAIPMNSQLVLYQLLLVIGTLVAIVFAMPIFILVVIPLAVVFYFLQKVYVTTARQA
jgi:ATP-binding cassette subfamily C (CFTR/MRP) protein 1